MEATPNLDILNSTVLSESKYVVVNDLTDATNEMTTIFQGKQKGANGTDKVLVENSKSGI